MDPARRQAGRARCRLRGDQAVHRSQRRASSLGESVGTSGEIDGASQSLRHTAVPLGDAVVGDRNLERRREQAARGLVFQAASR